MDVKSTVESYIDESDWRVKANANQNYNLSGLVNNNSGKVIANYWLDEVYPEEIGLAHREGDIHIHDLDNLSGYCAGWSLRELLEEGFGGVAKNVSARPPKHFSSACGQIVNFIGVLQSEWAGAQAFSSFDTYMAPFVRLDNLSLEQVKQSLQEMIFSLNVPSRWGQSPFSNLTFDWTCPDDLRDQYPLIGGEVCEFSYGDLQPEMDVINRAFIEVIGTGDGDGRPFTFPIPTYNITRDFDWDSPNANLLFQMTGKYGLPYFQNFINSTMNPEDVRSMCCRLRLDKRELLKRGNGLFGSAEKTGSIGVVTINMARLGYLHKNNREELFDALERLVELAVGSLEIKRVFVQRQMDAGLYPFSQRYLGTLRNHFSTVGVNGINEMVRNFTNNTDDITSEFGHQFALDVLDVINDRLQQYQESTGNLYNLEATPAEGTTYRFAKEDKKRFPDILQAGTKSNPYYTNSSQLPVDFTNDPFEALQQQDELQCKYTGGTVLHLYTGESVTNAKQIIYRAFTKFNLPYLSITPTFSVCKSHGFISGEHFECPECHDLCEVWTRVMGYFRPVQSFNVGKVGEFEERTYTNANNM